MIQSRMNDFRFVGVVRRDGDVAARQAGWVAGLGGERAGVSCTGGGTVLNRERCEEEGVMEQANTSNERSSSNWIPSTSWSISAWLKTLALDRCDSIARPPLEPTLLLVLAKLAPREAGIPKSREVDARLIDRERDGDGELAGAEAAWTRVGGTAET